MTFHFKLDKSLIYCLLALSSSALNAQKSIFVFDTLNIQDINILEYDSLLSLNDAVAVELNKYKNEVLVYRGLLINGKNWGIHTSFTFEGRISELTTYVNGCEDGLYMKFHENGVPSIEGSYLYSQCDSIQVDVTEYINPDTGEKELHYSSKRGGSEKNGEWKYYDEYGIIYKKEVWQNGQIINEYHN